MDENLQRQMAFNEKLHKLLEEAQGIKPFNYDNVFGKNNELKKIKSSSSKTQGIDNGRKGCRFVVGCNA
jgi:hypothetical protein